MEALTVTVALLLAVLETDAVIPAGAVPVVVPAAVVYHVTEPVLPSVIFAVVTVKVAVPAVPEVNIPLCEATDTFLVVAEITVNTTTPEVVPSIVVLNQ